MSVTPATSTIDLNDLRLTSDIQHFDPNAVPLQHGLTRDGNGRLCIKPDIILMLSPRELTRAERLLAAERTSEANSLVGCCHIHNVTSFCEGHEAEHAPVVCAKPLLDEKCATPRARASKFAYDHPELYEHLMARKFQVLTLTIPHTSERTPEKLHFDMTRGRSSFAKFAAKFHGRHGWKWLAGFNADMTSTTLYAIHEGCLPQQPTLESMWRGVTKPGATVRIRTFDGKDGDTQKAGMELAHSGFVNYWMAMHKKEGNPELAISLAFRDEDLTALYGYFRGFATIEDKQEALPLPICTVCGLPHVRQHMLMTLDELGKRFDHIRPPSYGKKRGRLHGNSSIAAPVAPSPPPW